MNGRTDGRTDRRMDRPDQTRPKAKQKRRRRGGGAKGCNWNAFHTSNRLTRVLATQLAVRLLACFIKYFKFIVSVHSVYVLESLGSIVPVGPPSLQSQSDAGEQENVVVLIVESHKNSEIPIQEGFLLGRKKEKLPPLSVYLPCPFMIDDWKENS